MGGKNRSKKGMTAGGKRKATSTKVANKKSNQIKRSKNAQAAASKAARGAKKQGKAGTQVGKQSKQTPANASKKGKRAKNQKTHSKKQNGTPHSQEESLFPDFAPSLDDEEFAYLENASNRSAFMGADLERAQAGGRHEKLSKKMQQDYKDNDRKAKADRAEEKKKQQKSFESDSEEEMEYERGLRDNRHWKDKPKSKLLPTKTPEGKWQQPTQPDPLQAKAGVESEDEDGEDDDMEENEVQHDFGTLGPDEEPEDSEGEADEGDEKAPVLTAEQLERRRRSRMLKQKLVIAKLCDAIMSNPDKHVGKMDTLLGISETDPDATVRQLSILSQVELYKDILPDYRIRLPTEKELQNKVGKEVRALRQFEQTLLSGYGRLVLNLCSTSKRLSQGKGGSRPPKELLVNVRALCLLLARGYAFNYRKELIRAVAPLLNCGYASLRQMASDAVATVFEEDKAGDAALEALTILCTIVKKKGSKLKPDVLAVFSKLPLSKHVLEAPDETKEQKRKKLNQLSKKAKRELDRHLNEGGQADAKHRKRTQTAMLTEVFVAYFRVIKHTTSSVCLPVVLKGLSQFAGLINVELVLDLLQNLQRLTQPGSGLGLESALHCISTAFSVLHTHGGVVDMDLKDFYHHLYSILWKMTQAEHHSLLPLLLHCLRLMFRFSKQLSTERVGAFVKRLAIVALHLPPSHAIAVAHCIRSFFQTCSRARQLLDADCTVSGVFMPLVDNPDLSNAFATTLWELTLLAQSSHPYQRDYCAGLARGDELSASEYMLPAGEVLRRYDATQGGFNPPIPAPATKRSKGEILKRKLMRKKANAPANMSPFLVVLNTRPADALDATDALVPMFRRWRSTRTKTTLLRYRKLAAQISRRNKRRKTDR